jgi:hypothetical protein
MIKFIKERLAKIREEKRLSQEDLAQKLTKKLGINIYAVRSLIKRTELGMSNITVKNLCKIAEELNVTDMNSFFELTGVHSPIHSLTQKTNLQSNVISIVIKVENDKVNQVKDALNMIKGVIEIEQ